MWQIGPKTVVISAPALGPLHLSQPTLEVCIGRVEDGRGSLGHAAFAEEPVGKPFPPCCQSLPQAVDGCQNLIMLAAQHVVLGF